MKNCAALFAELDRLEDDFIAFWRDITMIESPTHDKPGLDRVTCLINDTAERFGFLAETIPQEKAGNMARVTLCTPSSEKPIILSAHIDTVHPIGSFGQPPVRIEDGKIYGPGVLDDKSGVAAALYAMTALARCGYRQRNVIFLGQTDEEVSSAVSDKATINYMCTEAKQCEAFINLESMKPGKAVLRRKGIVRYELIIHGKASHSAKCYNGKNALLEAAHKIIALEAYKDKEGITCNCSMISGGDVANTVPEQCRFTVDIRYFTAEQLEQINTALHQIADTSYIGGTTCTVELVSMRPSMELTDADLELFNHMNTIYRTCGLPELEIGTSFGGSDAANVSACGVKTIDSIGCEGKYIHTTQEFAYVRSLKEAAQRIAALVWLYDEE